MLRNAVSTGIGVLGGKRGECIVSSTRVEIFLETSGLLSGVVQALIPSSTINKKYNLSMVGFVFMIDAYLFKYVVQDRYFYKMAALNFH
jgi:hypothetical protein